MKFDADKGDLGMVYDADGNLLPRPISGDTETGEVLCFATDRFGRFVMNSAGDLTRVLIKFKAPLRIENYHRGPDWGCDEPVFVQSRAE